MSITGAQIRAGRALVRWSAGQLAEAAKLGLMTIRRAEATDGIVGITEANAFAIRTALELAGVEFIPENGGGPGVRLKK
ncbi:transcriptional regulator [Xanthobacter aminoxidans]|uniref:transcriptional regulator n=1 Tax=Xanthobacter aminoxidans TaxID=186280 RepID=UPI00372A1F49